MASLIASLRVRDPEFTPITSAPSIRHVFGAHVHDAFQAQLRGDSGGGNAVLPCSGFRDHARLLHLHRQQALADGVINFVCAGVQQVFALEINFRARTATGNLGKMRGEARCKLQRRGTAGEVFQ